MKVTITNGKTADYIDICKPDGSLIQTSLPKKGAFPHDAVHFAVEKEIGLLNGFWGMVAAGCHPGEIQEIAKQAGHASASRAQAPGAHIVELLQSERLVECFEAELWSGESGYADFRAVARAACKYSHVPLPDLEDPTIQAIRNKLKAMMQDWTAGKISFEWNLTA